MRANWSLSDFFLYCLQDGIIYFEVEYIAYQWRSVKEILGMVNGKELINEFNKVFDNIATD